MRRMSLPGITFDLSLDVEGFHPITNGISGETAVIQRWKAVVPGARFPSQHPSGADCRTANVGRSATASTAQPTNDPDRDWFRRPASSWVSEGRRPGPSQDGCRWRQSLRGVDSGEVRRNPESRSSPLSVPVEEAAPPGPARPDFRSRGRHA